MKICAKCKEYKSIDNFHKWKYGKDGLQSTCKLCTKKANYEWYLKNIEHRRETSKNWYDKNPERKTETQNLWVKNNKEKAQKYSIVKNLNRRARKLKAGGSFTKLEVDNLFKLQKGLCIYCRCNLLKYHIDHIMPLSLGGNNDIKNIQLLCKTCNLKKHNKHPIDWAQKNGRLL